MFYKNQEVVILQQTTALYQIEVEKITDDGEIIQDSFWVRKEDLTETPPDPTTNETPKVTLAETVTQGDLLLQFLQRNRSAVNSVPLPHTM
jgi:hypothetical protein